MRQKNSDFNGWGHWGTKPGSFVIDEYHLERPWGYIYTTEKMLLRINHNGSGYAQVNPPGGIMLFKQERYEKTPAFMVWFVDDEQNVFSNFFQPNFLGITQKPETYQCTFCPESAEYRMTLNGWAITTRIAIAKDTPSIIMKVQVTNHGAACGLRAIPVWRAHNCKPDLALWDVPELYQSCKFFNNHGTGIMVETRDPDAHVANRKYTVIQTDLPVSDAELRFEKFVGRGSFENPEALFKPDWLIRNDIEYCLEEFRAPDAMGSQLPIAALRSDKITLKSGESLNFTVVLHHLDETDYTRLSAAITPATAMLSDDFWNQNQEKHEVFFRDLMGKFHTVSPDENFNRYINEWLPLQLYWVSKLDRGWPTGMRGTRDAAQDFSGISYLYPDLGRKMLATMFSCQRLDGSFPRQFSTQGPEGKHDLRDYSDSGCWVFELLCDYLNLSGDYAFLNTTFRWLDATEPATVREHAESLLAYYIDSANRGIHGLIKIRAGDWNDSINNAGLQGRGESTMVSCHVVYLLQLAAELLPEGNRYLNEAAVLRNNIRKYALNNAGFLNGVFTDNGEWLFSVQDPDGCERVNSPANSFGIIAGIFEPEELDRVIAKIETLKGPNGYRLFYPPLGRVPIKMAGRLGSGDIAPGNVENGTVYNHGSQGFLIRALATAGYGSMALQVLRYALPYDQTLHPVEKCKTEPYGILNCWSEAPGRECEGEKTFLSGTISTVFRAFYNGLAGFHPKGNGLEITPCLPHEWPELAYTGNYKQYQVNVEVVMLDEAARCGLWLNDIKLNGTFIPDALLKDDSVNKVVLKLQRHSNAEILA